MPTLAQRPSTGPTTASGRRRRPVARWKIVVAIIAAILLHVGLILLLAWALPHWPRPPLHKGSAEPISLSIESAPTPTPGLHPTESVQQQPEYIRTPDDRKSDTPPPDPKFITDKDTQAAAEKPPDDMTKPLPSQDGREIPTFDFETNPYIPGQEAHDNLAVAAPASQAAPTPPPVNPTPAPTPTPMATPTPSPGDFALVKSDSSPSNTPPSPAPSATPRSTPPPVKDALQAQADRVARENASVNSRSIQQPPGYQPQTTQTKMSGAVDNRGRSSVAALGTPLGRYEKAVSDAIGARWYFNVDQNMSTLVRTGEVKIHFVITRSGKIINTHVIGKNGNTTLADVSIEAITSAELPPMPSDVAGALPEGQLEVDYAFSLFEQ